MLLTLIYTHTHTPEAIIITFNSSLPHQYQALLSSGLSVDLCFFREGRQEEI